MAGDVWQLYRTNGSDEWELTASSDSLRALARRIIDIEALSVQSLVFHMHVDLTPKSDSDDPCELEYRGKHAFYVIRRRPPSET